jgi:hypothetical protein
VLGELTRLPDVLVTLLLRLGIADACHQHRNISQTDPSSSPGLCPNRYMVRNSLWAAAGMERGFLGVGCLERRLGRLLRPADFTAVPINDPGHP